MWRCDRLPSPSFYNLSHFASTMDASQYSCLHLQHFHGAPGVLWPNWSSGKGAILYLLLVVSRESPSDSRRILKKTVMLAFLLCLTNRFRDRTLCSEDRQCTGWVRREMWQSFRWCKFFKFYLNDVMMRQNGFLASSVGIQWRDFWADDTTVFSTARSV